MILLALLLACDSGAPAALPPAAPVAPPVDARAVAMGSVRGFLAKPLPEAATGQRALLVGEGAIDERGRAEARCLAARGEVVLLVDLGADEAAATAYLEGRPGAGPISRRAVASASPCVSQSP